MNIDPDLNDDLGSTMGTDTLLAHNMVPEVLPASSNGPAEQRVHHIEGARYLGVDQTTNRHHNSRVPKILQYGMELRVVDNLSLDKYWLCHRCLPATQIHVLPVHSIAKSTNLYSWQALLIWWSFPNSTGVTLPACRPASWDAASWAWLPCPGCSAPFAARLLPCAWTCP